MKPELLHRGSVKDIYRISENELLFDFSDRYSIFDWGEMPDAIPGKGRALAQMGAKFLAHLEKRGVATHFLRTETKAEAFVVKRVHVPREDVSVYQRNPNNILIPLEVIFRFGAPMGSSLLRRYGTEADWKKAGYDRAYREGEFFSELKIDFTTKLERLDRVLEEKEAQMLAGMNDREWAELKQTTFKVASELRSVFVRMGAVLWDGKFEFALDPQRKIMLVDSIGLDEMRLTFEGQPLSKELLRQYYLKTPWYEALTRAKTVAGSDFKSYCQTVLKHEPDRLPSAAVVAVSSLYQTVADLILCEEAKKRELQTRLTRALEQLVRRA